MTDFMRSTWLRGLAWEEGKGTSDLREETGMQIVKVGRKLGGVAGRR